MLDKTLNAAECKKMILDNVDVIRTRRSSLPDLLQQGKITRTEFSNLSSKMSNSETTLLGLANDLSVVQIQNILTDLNEPGEQIQNVTNKLEKAIAKLEEINKVLRILTDVVNFFQTVVSNFSGGFAVTAIAPILDGLERLSGDF